MEVPNDTFLKNNPKTSIRIRIDGTIQLEYYLSEEEKEKQILDYDTIRLLINPIPNNIGQYELYKCKVLWFNKNDKVYIPKGEIYDDYLKEQEDILMGIDEKLLFTDEEYYSFLMKYLIEKSRVKSYIEEGKKDNPEIKRGRYIGRVIKQNDKYEKVFEYDLGNICHDSHEMKWERYQNRINEEQQHINKINDKDAQIYEYQKKIQKLQQEKEKLIKNNPYEKSTSVRK